MWRKNSRKIKSFLAPLNNGQLDLPEGDMNAELTFNELRMNAVTLELSLGLP